MIKIITKEGDTVYKLAVLHFGDIMAYLEICKVNNIPLAEIDTELEPGLNILIPETIPKEISLKRYKWWIQNKKVILC